MNYDELKVWIDAAQFLWIIAATIWAFWGDRHRETKEELAAHAGSINELRALVARAEHLATQAPTHDDIGDVHEKLNEINGEVKGLTAEIKGLHELLKSMQHPVNTITEFLINQGK
jgi:hypothetical protein